MFTPLDSKHPTGLELHQTYFLSALYTLWYPSPLLFVREGEFKLSLLWITQGKLLTLPSLFGKPLKRLVLDKVCTFPITMLKHGAVSTPLRMNLGQHPILIG
jgi:hypothetical protein